MANQYLPHYTPTTPPSYQPQQFFPQPQGNVYLINNSLEVANIPVGAGMSFAYCSSEGLLYIKALQNGNPIFLTYRMLPYEGKSVESTSQTVPIEQQDPTQTLSQFSEKIDSLCTRLDSIEKKIGGKRSNEF